jgi:hypothetical protein
MLVRTLGGSEESDNVSVGDSALVDAARIAMEVGDDVVLVLADGDSFLVVAR